MADIALTELEIRYTHLERLVNELSGVVYRQQQELDAVKELYVKLKERLPADGGLVDAARHDVPPHY
jgi:SlyX protein